MSGVVPYANEKGEQVYDLGNTKVVLNPNSAANRDIDKIIDRAVYVTDDDGKVIPGADGQPVFQPGKNQHDLIKAVHDATHEVVGEYDEVIGRDYDNDPNNDMSAWESSNYYHSRDGDSSREWYIGDAVTTLETMPKGKYVCAEFAVTEHYHLSKRGVSDATVHVGNMSGYDPKKSDDLGLHAYVSVNDGKNVLETTQPKGSDPVKYVTNPETFKRGEATAVLTEYGDRAGVYSEHVYTPRFMLVSTYQEASAGAKDAVPIKNPELNEPLNTGQPIPEKPAPAVPEPQAPQPAQPDQPQPAAPQPAPAPTPPTPTPQPEPAPPQPTPAQPEPTPPAPQPVTPPTPEPPAPQPEPEKPKPPEQVPDEQKPAPRPRQKEQKEPSTTAVPTPAPVNKEPQQTQLQKQDNNKSPAQSSSQKADNSLQTSLKEAQNKILDGKANDEQAFAALNNAAEKLGVTTKINIPEGKNISIPSDKSIEFRDRMKEISRISKEERTPEGREKAKQLVESLNGDINTAIGEADAKGRVGTAIDKKEINGITKENAPEVFNKLNLSDELKQKLKDANFEEAAKQLKQAAKDGVISEKELNVNDIQQANIPKTQNTQRAQGAHK